MMRVLDLWCKAGGASMGYHQAGFEVYGVDPNPQKRYPFGMVVRDPLTLSRRQLSQFDVIHASPPCGAWSTTRRIRNNPHDELLWELRLKLDGMLAVIESVPSAPLAVSGSFILCGSMFDDEMSTYRHRKFQVSLPPVVLRAPAHPEHVHPQAKLGRAPGPGQWMHVVGHFANVEAGRRAMGIDWMSRDELGKAVPPAYTRWIGREIRSCLDP